MAHPSGVGLGIHGADEPSRDLTSNLGIVATHDEAVRLSVNVRYPVTWKGDDVRNRCQAWLDEKSPGAKVADFHDSPPLYFALDSPLVETIIDAYREETGDMTAPGVMGGGTYARKLPNTVSIGTGWLGDGEAHQTNERLKVDHLFKMSRIYAAILYKLALRATMES